MPTKAKPNTVNPSYTQEEAKELSRMLENHRLVLQSIGDQERAALCEALRGKLVHASGKVAAP